MKLRVTNTEFDPITQEIYVGVDGHDTVWIDLDTLIAKYHGAEQPTKDSIRRAVGAWLKERCTANQKKEVQEARYALAELKGELVA